MSEGGRLQVRSGASLSGATASVGLALLPAASVGVFNVGLQANRWLAAHEAEYGRDHPQVIGDYANMVGFHLQQGDTAGAQRYYAQAFDLDADATLPGEPWMGTMIASFADRLYEQDNAAEANAIYRHWIAELTESGQGDGDDAVYLKQQFAERLNSGAIRRAQRVMVSSQSSRCPPYSSSHSGFRYSSRLSRRSRPRKRPSPARAHRYRKTPAPSPIQRPPSGTVPAWSTRTPR